MDEQLIAPFIACNVVHVKLPWSILWHTISKLKIQAFSRNCANLSFCTFRTEAEFLFVFLGFAWVLGNTIYGKWSNTEDIFCAVILLEYLVFQSQMENASHKQQCLVCLQELNLANALSYTTIWQDNLH